MNIDWQGANDIKELYGYLIDEEINKPIQYRDHNSIPIPNEVVKKFARLGLFTYMLPKKFGGQEVGDAIWGSILEKIGYLSSDTSFPFLISVRMSFISALIVTEKEYIIEQYVSQLVAGDEFGAFAYTENADAFSFTTNAIRQHNGDSYILNGVKQFITGGATANIFLVFVRSDNSDLQVFLVKRSDAGVDITPRVMHGVHSLGIAQLNLNNVKLDKNRLLVATDGLSFVQRYFLNCRRSLLATLFLGGARAIIEKTISYLQRTIRYDEPLAEMQHVQAAIGRMSIGLETARAMVYHSLERQARKESDPYWDPISSAAKHYAIEQINIITLTALKLTGGWGYTEDSGLGRSHRDFTSMLAGADPQEKLEVDLGIRVIHDFQMLKQQKAALEERKNEI
ncbi:acyl-CoA dehydrogenase family protein [Yersinia enterocolitica]|uniref:acyl-CoA dehydrogenase family protein n=1 Tax=Yersinia enterocolitica TaxID=630 RepID=UPI001C678018|nr:acyl-CoA dehydrogenase family protein [Yersinia enterocolitica]MBW5835284.1 acyl-CoA/acyl-ACP dehydrogenase [Yersinia enterocolitica]MBX9477148.1 acyl-CoA/acyl-ACP dehydrogenase [Yersinia enterocolitica]MBX9488541.1 acyl-CoA/acyl-ACP dehydrogenase [Yersinia enterocolitica]MBX9493104.1 acyl-CoA/acyl-ACP dehydrogenase [Yersinia enterocolitica]